MKTNRIEAFSDGVMAILITIMVLELKAPRDPTPASLAGMWPTFFAYVLSFIIIAIYWVNHHYLIQIVNRIDAAMLWANMNMLFWISLIPWATVYLGDNHALPFPVALYAGVSAAGAISFYLLRASIARHHHEPEFKRLNKRMARRKSSRPSHLYRGHRSGVHLHTARANHDCVAGSDVLFAGPRLRVFRPLAGSLIGTFRLHIPD
jgi:uncharacterized membrane protein